MDARSPSHCLRIIAWRIGLQSQRIDHVYTRQSCVREQWFTATTDAP